jgi:acyl carrier protein
MMPISSEAKLSPEQVQQVQTTIEKIAFRKVAENEPLLSTQLIDSIGFVDLVVALENQFKIRIDVNSVSERNFNTLTDIVKYLDTKVG